jgi:hypothetical protein
LRDGVLAGELLHLPGKPAGVEEGRWAPRLAGELLHLPGKPAGVGEGALRDGVLAGEPLHLPDKPAGVGSVPTHGFFRARMCSTRRWT